MKTWERTIKHPLRIVEDDAVFELVAGKKIWTSQVRFEQKRPVVTAFSNYWVTVPSYHFDRGVQKTFI